MNADKVLREVIAHFIANEGTDYLSHVCTRDFPSLSEEEFQYLLTIRDQAREQMGWAYPGRIGPAL